MEKLYAEYGELMIQMEILNGRIIEIKRKIAETLNTKNTNAGDGGRVENGDSAKPVSRDERMQGKK